MTPPISARAAAMRSSAASASRVNWPGSAILVTVIGSSIAPRMAVSFVLSSAGLDWARVISTQALKRANAGFAHNETRERHRTGARAGRRPAGTRPSDDRALARRRACAFLEPARLRRYRHAHRCRWNMVLLWLANWPGPARAAVRLDHAPRGRPLCPGDAGRKGRNQGR